MRVSNNQLFAAACELLSTMVQETESAAFSDHDLVKRAIKLVMMVAEALPEDDKVSEDFLDDNQISAAIALAFENTQSTEIKASQLNMELRKIIGCKYRTAIAYIQRAEQLGVINTTKDEDKTTIYSLNTSD